jgi:hypothetical protein
MDTPKIPNTSVETSLKWIAARAWHDRAHPAVERWVRALVRSDVGARAKVASVVDWVRSLCSNVDPTTAETLAGLPELLAGGVALVPIDADDAVLIAATVCLTAGVECKVVGARFGHCWTCWLAYQDETGQWVTVDAQTGERAGERRVPDEQVIVDCPPDGPRGPSSDRWGER